MESVIKTFTCVLRHTHNADDIINNVNALSDGTALPGNISDNDRLGILDFPDTATQDANVATSTSLSKVELLERAVSAPSELSVKEYRLLEQRFWLDLTAAELETQTAAQLALATSEEVFYQVTGQLKKVRAMLHDNNEEAALLNAGNEEWRRMLADLNERDKQEVESRLPTAQSWVKRLWDEEQGEKNWGYAVYRAPEAVNEEYECRRDARLDQAKLIAGCVGTMSRNWRLQYLDWPDSPSLSQAPLCDPAGEDSGRVEDRVEPGRPKRFLGLYNPPDMYTASQLQARFLVLRQHFIAARDDTTGKQETASNSQTSRSGLQDGILRNVFLVIDQQCIDCLLSRKAHPDYAWVYAVDPDYLQSTDTATHETPSNEYRGYMRVRVDQLANNFFDARKYHEDEFPMQVLWQAAQLSRLQAFVSVEEAEQRIR
jgi:hypothetical protein